MTELNILKKDKTTKESAKYLMKVASNKPILSDIHCAEDVIHITQQLIKRQLKDNNFSNDRKTLEIISDVNKYYLCKQKK